jgi:aminoglycoside 3-N-acetyltransferase
VLARKDRIRGNHPLCSFAAIGPLAGSIIARQTPIDVFAPLRALAEAGGWVVLIGTGLHSMTLLHAAEELAGRRPFIRWANGPGGKPIGVSMGGCSLGFEKLAPALAPLEKKWTVGRSAWRAFPAAETLETASAAIRADPEITRCADENCPRCGDQVLGGPVG